MSEPIIVREVIKEIEYADDELTGKTIKEVIEYFSQWPLDAKYDIEGEVSYDCAYVNASVYRMRPETVEEMQKRIASSEFSDNYERERKRKLYEELKKEFEE